MLDAVYVTTMERDLRSILFCTGKKSIWREESSLFLSLVGMKLTRRFSDFFPFLFFDRDNAQPSVFLAPMTA